MFNLKCWPIVSFSSSSLKNAVCYQLVIRPVNTFEYEDEEEFEYEYEGEEEEASRQRKALNQHFCLRIEQTRLGHINSKLYGLAN